MSLFDFGSDAKYVAAIAVLLLTPFVFWWRTSVPALLVNPWHDRRARVPVPERYATERAFRDEFGRQWKLSEGIKWWAVYPPNSLRKFLFLLPAIP